MGTGVFEVTVDGRRLIAEAFGPEDGDVVLFHTGTPGARLLDRGQLRAGAERGLRHVIYMRPGYEGSDRLPGRSYADSARDSAAVVDALGAERFYSLGVSGGGGPSLACAALLGDRCLAAASAAALGPRAGEGLDWLAGAAEASVEEFGLVGDDEALARYLRASATRYGEIETAAQLRQAFLAHLSAADIAVLDGPFLDYQLEGIRRIAADGIWGWFDDDVAMSGPWGFDLASISVPVTIWQGGTDKFVPPQNGRWLADRIPGAEPRFFERDGHLSLVRNRYGAILDDLIARART